MFRKWDANFQFVSSSMVIFSYVFSRNDIMKTMYEESIPLIKFWPKTPAFILLSLKPDNTHSFEYVLHVLNDSTYQTIHTIESPWFCSNDLHIIALFGLSDEQKG